MATTQIKFGEFFMRWPNIGSYICYINASENTRLLPRIRFAVQTGVTSDPELVSALDRLEAALETHLKYVNGDIDAFESLCEAEREVLRIWDRLGFTFAN